MEANSQLTTISAEQPPRDLREAIDLRLRHDLDQIATLQSYQWLKEYSRFGDYLEYCARESIRMWAESLVELSLEIGLLVGEEHRDENYRRVYNAVHVYATRGPALGYPSDELAALGKKILDQWLQFEVNRSILPKLKELDRKQRLIAQGKESGEARRRKSDEARARALGS